MTEHRLPQLGPRVQPFLESDETVRAIATGTALMSPEFRAKWLIVAVTERNVYLFAGKGLKTMHPARIISKWPLGQVDVRVVKGRPSLLKVGEGNIQPGSHWDDAEAVAAAAGSPGDQSAAIQFTHRGQRYLLGVHRTWRKPKEYCIWDQEKQGPPVNRYSDWESAWREFLFMEPDPAALQGSARLWNGEGTPPPGVPPSWPPPEGWRPVG